MIPTIKLQDEKIGDWSMQVLVLDGHSQILALPVHGIIGNTIAERGKGSHRTVSWKLKIGNAVKSARGSDKWASNDRYAITLGFAFHPKSHGNQPLDVENFIKPTLDALSAGLFCDQDVDLSLLEGWKYDDSHFNHFLVHRLFDAATAGQEGVAVFVSAARSAK
jgi:hypothetical protein